MKEYFGGLKGRNIDREAYSEMIVHPTKLVKEKFSMIEISRRPFVVSNCANSSDTDVINDTLMKYYDKCNTSILRKYKLKSLPWTQLSSMIEIILDSNIHVA